MSSYRVVKKGFGLIPEINFKHLKLTVNDDNIGQIIRPDNRDNGIIITHKTYNLPRKCLTFIIERYDAVNLNTAEPEVCRQEYLRGLGGGQYGDIICNWVLRISYTLTQDGKDAFHQRARGRNSYSCEQACIGNGKISGWTGTDSCLNTQVANFRYCDMVPQLDQIEDAIVADIHYLEDV